MKGFFKTLGTLILIMLVLAIFSRCTNGVFENEPISRPSTPIPTLKPEKKAVISTITPSMPIVGSGELSKYLDQIQKYSIVNVRKIDGTLDARPDDLKQLCLDWYFYRARDPGKFSEINLWLNEYNEDDVTAMLTHIEQKDW